MTRKRNRDTRPRALVIRLGAIGDLILCGPVLQALHETGYHVTLLAKKKATFIFKNSGLVDKHIIWGDADEAFVDEYAQGDESKIYEACVVRAESYGGGYDKVLNLMGIVEGELMAKAHEFSEEFVRTHPLGKHWYRTIGHGRWEKDALGNVGWEHRNDNHIDYIMARAGFDGDEWKGRLPVWVVSPGERKWVHKLWKKEGVDPKRHFIVTVQLSGSGIAKSWPYWPEFCHAARRMCGPDLRIFTIGVGDEELLELGWSEQMPWVIAMAGRHAWHHDGDLEDGTPNWVYKISPISLRHHGALVQMSDCYVGPDTSFLHVAGACDVPKVALLTITSHENITKYYRNAHPVHAYVECSPCGKITTSCRHGKRTGAAYCMEAITPSRVLKELKEVHEQWREEERLKRQSA